MTTGKHKPETYPDGKDAPIAEQVLKGIPCVIDSNGVYWYFFKNEKRITVLDKDSKPAEGGYWCENLEDGIYYLKKDGFIE